MVFLYIGTQWAGILKGQTDREGNVQPGHCKSAVQYDVPKDSLRLWFLNEVYAVANPLGLVLLQKHELYVTIQSETVGQMYLFCYWCMVPELYATVSF